MRASRLLSVALTAGLLFFQSSCAIPPLSHLNSYLNKPLQKDNRTNARKFPAPNPEYFIGMAFSGGGSRAANFSAAVMWELHKLGVLEHVQYVSSVSGGSLPAAYYALFKDSKDKWNQENLREVFSQNFELWAWLYSLSPSRAVKFLGTGYDRTDVMAEVFENRLYFDETAGRTKTFDDLKHLKDGIPRLIINATNFVFGDRPFTFTNEDFTDQLRSDLSSLSIGRAVVTSAAFPALLRNATYAVFEKGSQEVERYQHLLDGGPSDNLGIESVLAIYDQELVRLGNDAFRRGCLIIMVDSYTPFYDKEEEERPDTRRFYDFPIDINTATNSFSIFLQTKRRKTLQRLGFDKAHLQQIIKTDEPVGFLENMKVEQVPDVPQETFRERTLVQEKMSKCHVWHIAFTQFRPLTYDSDYNRQVRKRYEPPFNEIMQRRGMDYSYEAFRDEINKIPTRFSISEKDAENLYTAAEILVNEKTSRARVCAWMEKITGRQLKGCS